MLIFDGVIQEYSGVLWEIVYINNYYCFDFLAMAAGVTCSIFFEV